MSKMILILVDGIGADFFAQYRHLLPHMNRLACEGLTIERLAPETCATSLPGRASILTGVPAREHGIYGNIIWDGTTFRYASPYDVKSPAITRLAMDSGRNVACIGYGMAQKEDCQLFHPPFWVQDYMAESVEDENCGWRKTCGDESDFVVGKCCIKTIHSRLIHQPCTTNGYEMIGQINDQIMMDRLTELALSKENTPDFLLTEIAMPDYFFHQYGSHSEHGLWAAIAADSMIGRLVSQLEQADLRSEWTLAIMSDHGHADVEGTLFPNNFLPSGTRYACESSILHVAVKSESDYKNIADRLKDFSVEPLEGQHIPPGQTSVRAFLAKDKIVFEDSKPDCQLPEGESHYVSSHGFRFGHASDERFAIFSGLPIPSSSVYRASAEQIAPTMAQIMNLPVARFPDTPLL